MRINKLVVSDEQVDEIRATARRNAEFHGDETYLTYGQHEALAVAIQMANDSGTPVHVSWYVGLGGSWGEQVFGDRPPEASTDAWVLAELILEPVDDEFNEFNCGVQDEMHRIYMARRVRAMGIGMTPSYL